MPFIRVNQSNSDPMSIGLITAFLESAGDSINTFRYFNKRPVSVVQQHLCTWIFVDDHNAPVAYGHLDQEDGNVWLGIAVSQGARGKGYGRQMMNQLLASAKGMGVFTIRLSVDATNSTAIQLYEQFDFRLVEERGDIRFYTLQLPFLREAVVSSLAFPGQPAETMIALAQEHKFILEFSSGLPYRDDMEQLFRTTTIRRFAHNYFPAPQHPFVLNLGSGDSTIRETSIRHCIQGIRLSASVEAPFFSAHAGFCVDPRPEELGHQLKHVEGYDRLKHWNLFIDAVQRVLVETADLPTGFLLENNILAVMNRSRDGSNPLLGVEAEELLQVLEAIPDPRLGILLDTAHLKVSAETLGFDKNEAVEKLLPYIRCIHHSDNDGLRDTNQHIDPSYWFLPHMPNAAHAVHVLEVRQASPKQLNEMSRILFA